MTEYKDPLHIPSAQLVVWHDGKEALILNKALLDQQNCWTNLEKIKALHVMRLELEDLMVASPGLHRRNMWTKIQFELQDAWGFPRDSKFHRFWDIKGCLCPKMDNDEQYPTGYYIQVGDCPIHGEEI